MNFLVDTSVWSLALRRDAPGDIPEVDVLATALAQGDMIFTTGLILQELLQGFRGPKAGDAIVARFSSLPLLLPSRADHIGAAALRNSCRRRGIQVGTVDALLAELCIAHDLTILTTDADFRRVAEITPLSCWTSPA